MSTLTWLWLFAFGCVVSVHLTALLIRAFRAHPPKRRIPPGPLTAWEKDNLRLLPPPNLPSRSLFKTEAEYQREVEKINRELTAPLAWYEDASARTLNLEHDYHRLARQRQIQAARARQEARERYESKDGD